MEEVTLTSLRTSGLSIDYKEKLWRRQKAQRLPGVVGGRVEDKGLAGSETTAEEIALTLLQHDTRVTNDLYAATMVDAQQTNLCKPTEHT